MKKKKGFTLVELSIVLVVIGLLIGGILAAQSMISTSKVEAVAMQVGQFDAGVENFKTKYNYLPGDAPAFGGDGDGIIAEPAYTGPNSKDTIVNFDCEIANFWNNIDPGNYTAPTPICNYGFGPLPVSTGPNKNVPASKIGRAGSLFIASAAGDTNGGEFVADTVNVRNYYAILSASQISDSIFQTTTSANASVKPIDLLALDTKIDDGLADHGNVRSASIALPGSVLTSGKLCDFQALSTCSQGSTYQVQNNSYECTPAIRIGASVNDPQ